MRTTIACLTLICLLNGTAARAQQDWSAELATKIDKVFEHMDKATSPGCALGLVRDGRLVYARGYGTANLDHDVAITPSTVFDVASISKQFTAAAIHLLVRDGKLSLDDDVRKYVPELPDFGDPITVRHLLHHTSGLRDQFELLILAGWRYSLDLITDDDVLQLMARQKDLNFRPGADHVYCNTGYTLLATIVSRVSGQTFRAFTMARLFKPLGMTRTFFRDDHAEVIKGQAYGYVPDRDTFRLSVTNFDTAGASSLHTTVEDMARWDHNFTDGGVGGLDFVATLLKKGTLAKGDELPSASRLIHGTYRGLATVGHGGVAAGYRSDYLRFPGVSASVVSACNLSSANPSELNRRVADIWLADKLGPVPAVSGDDRPTVSLSAEELRRYEGLYWVRGTDTYRRFVAKNGAIETVWGQSGTPLKAVGAGVFAGRTTDFRVEMSADKGRRLTESVRGSSVKPIQYESVEPFLPTAVQAAEYSGAYRSDEIDPIYRVDVIDGRVVVRRMKFAAVTLEPLTRDVFRGTIGTLRFSRATDGRISGFTISNGRIRGLRFHAQRP